MNLKPTRTTALAGLALAAAVTVGAVAPVQAAERPARTATTPASTTAGDLGATADEKTPVVSVSMDQLGVAGKVADAVRGVKTSDRGKFVQEAVKAAFDAAGGRHNVMLFNLSQNYDDRFQGTRVYANVKWGNIYYGLWIFESGTFANGGDGGWINWGMMGWFDRNGGAVTFHRSW
ncbi:stress protein [Streptomyces termitum]|uniref:Stress response protein YvgO n=1 Tax=Streptomyces termitum TaxID=67368 RepID=A0A918W8Q0_9ACTN|nr:stress protein [Streptomyces termitum]GHA86631.1 stress response protein YvgO [Streptomyces termitum]